MPSASQADPPSRRPLLDPETAASLLESVVYDRVLECIDLDGLFDFERDLWLALEGCGIEDEERVLCVAKDLIDRALCRIRADPRRYVNMPRCAGSSFATAHCGRGVLDCVTCANAARPDD